MNGVGRGFLDGFLVVNAVGHSMVVVVAWNETMFSRVDAWMGHLSVMAKLKWLTDDFEIVVASTYSPMNATKRKDLWRE